MPSTYILPKATIANPSREYTETNGIAVEKYSGYDVFVIGDVSNTDIVYACLVNGGVDYLTRSPNQAFWARHSSMHKYDLNQTKTVDGVLVYYYLSGNPPADNISFDRNFSDIQEAAEYIYQLGQTYPITYRPTNCTFPNAPTEAVVGETVTVPVSFPDGYGVVNPSDIYVTCNGVTVPSTYNNGTLTFTMPDPSQ